MENDRSEIEINGNIPLIPLSEERQTSKVGKQFFPIFQNPLLKAGYN
ncbi:MAG TPA: hypothetical protein VGK38_05865 [Prolixibacteraceae bacterium]|jgi:hypothetical protein